MNPKPRDTSMRAYTTIWFQGPIIFWGVVALIISASKYRSGSGGVGLMAAVGIFFLVMSLATYVVAKRSLRSQPQSEDPSSQAVE